MGDSWSAIAQRWPAWRTWQGVTGMCYASTRHNLATWTVRAHNWAVLAERIEAADAALRRPP